MKEIFKQNFSYKLDISIQPNWYNLYKKICSPKNEKQFDKEVSEKIKKIKNDDTSSLYGRRYQFTEYYDSASGLITRFTRAYLNNEKQYFYPVDEFRDSGYIFEEDNKIGGPNDTEEKRQARHKLSVQVGEDFIRNDIFDKYVGGPRADFDYKKQNYLFQFPLTDVFNFLFSLGERFHETEMHTIIKWPDNIEKKFKESGINYKTYFDHEPEQFDIEKHDKVFFEKIGKPKISLYSDSTGRNEGFFETEDNISYNIKLKIFRPNENDRILER